MPFEVLISKSWDIYKMNIYAKIIPLSGVVSRSYQGRIKVVFGSGLKMTELRQKMHKNCIKSV